MNESQQENKLEFIMQPSIDSDQGAEARQFVQELRPQEFSEPVSSNSSVSGDGDSSDTDTDTNSKRTAENMKFWGIIVMQVFRRPE